MPEVVYVLCAATALLAAGLLARGYGQSRTRLILWSMLCFLGLAANNVLLVVDLMVIGPDIDLSMARTGTAVVGLSLLVFGLIWESR